MKKIVPWEECVILKKWSTKQIFSPWKIISRRRFISESLVEIGNRGSTIIGTLCLETKLTYRGNFKV